jgi:hypothetical protein
VIARLLALAERCCGPHVRAQVFEALLADCQREWIETRGMKRAQIAAGGAWAFTIALLRCAQPAHAFAAAPTASFLITLTAFGIAGTVVRMQPFNYRWLGAGLDLSWHVPYGPFPDVTHFVPYALATTLGFALLPVMMAATAAGWRWRKRLCGLCAALVVIVVTDGWLAPRVLYERSRPWIERLPEPHRALAVREYAPLSEVVVLAQGENPELAHAARLGLRDKLQMLAGAFAFALMGAAIGSARRRAGVKLGVSTLTGWWLGAWLLYNALEHWSQIAVILLSLARDWRPWIAPLFFAVLSGLLLLADAIYATRSRQSPSA